ncbi:MAG TPA: zinc-dependent alcohol dehydrogenase family protein [Verrucomicrobiae bacterium]|jgi:alcohol dehydrogenase, propanol-preferring|nr:zinc-dependent alcohol dehydrogenase family protein [Verrucomicrobiae bacterium]
MLAAQLHAPRPIEDAPLQVVRLPDPRPALGEVLIRVGACGICHTDLHTAEGDLELPRLPTIPGHQIAGVVEALGQGVTRFAEGHRVGAAWLRRSCGQCLFCQQGNENLCERAEFTGLHADGGYAEFAVADATFVYALPERFSDIEVAPLLCGGVIGYRSMKVSGIRRGGRLGLYGFGASAHVVIQIARYWDCEVYVFTRGAEHQRLARDLGAAWVGRAEENPPKKIDAAIIFAPAGPLVLDALRVLERGATVALAGITMTPIPAIDYPKLLYHERKIASVANATRRDAEELLALAADIPLATEVEVFGLGEINAALTKLKRGQIRGAGVVAMTY